MLLFSGQLIWFTLQIAPAPPSGWERAGIVTILVAGICLIGWSFLRGWVVVGTQYAAKVKECEAERERADAAENKYTQILLADIEERKSRDKTLELLSRAASRNNQSPFDSETREGG